MADKKSLAKVYRLDDYRPKPKNPGPLPQQVFEELLRKLANNDFSIDGLLLSYMGQKGYEQYGRADFERQLYVCRDGDTARYISNRDFLTDKPTLCTVVLEDKIDCMMLESRFDTKMMGSVARLQQSGAWQRSDATPYLLGAAAGVGMALTGVAYAVFGEAGVVIMVPIVGVALSCYFIGKRHSNLDKQGLLPVYLARRQVDASSDPQRFFEEAFGVTGASFIN